MDVHVSELPKGLRSFLARTGHGISVNLPITSGQILVNVETHH